MKVLIPEKFGAEGIEVLEDAGVQADYLPDTTPEELLDIIDDYEGLIVRSATTVTREVIERGSKLKIIGRAGVGVDNIDSEAATERGIIVCNAPTSNVVSAAEQTMCLMLATARNTARADASMRAGKWDRSKFSGHELQQKTLAIFGLGRVGGLVAERAAAFDMELIGYDPYCTPERAAHLGVTLMTDINEICAQADFITVHLPKTKETTGMFSTEQYECMKDGVYLINVARGGIFDLEAMAVYLENGKIGGAGIDVWENEPVSDSPVHKFENVVMTPHLGASTKEAQVRAATQIAEYVIAGLEGKTVMTALNTAPVSQDVLNKVGPYMPIAQRTGVILAQLAPAAIESVKVEAFGNIADTDISTLATSLLAGVVSLASDVEVNVINAGHIAEQRGITVETGSDPMCESYASSVRFTACTAEGDVDIECTLAPGEEVGRMVQILGYKTDFIPSDNIIILRYVDGPGHMGRIGTVLGDAGVDVTTMQIAKNDTDVAEILMNVDQPLSPDLQKKLVEAAGADSSWFIEL